MSRVPETLKVHLNNGTEMPMIGLGTWRANDMDVYNVVLKAIESGYRHFDTAFVYGNEREVGQAIQKQIADGKVKREDLFIVTKLPNIHHDPQAVEKSCRKSLSNLGLEYVDLYLMHTPMSEKYREEQDYNYQPDDTDYLETWLAMEKLVSLGLTKGIGVSNFNSLQIQRILDNCNIKPTCNQVECHPAFNQKRLIKFCHERDIALVAYCPLGRPNAERKTPSFIYGSTIQNLAKKYSKTPAQMCLRYLLQIGAIPIPKTTKADRLVENFKVFDFQLSEEDMQIIDKFNTNNRWIPFSMMHNHKFYPFNNKVEY